MSMSETVVQSVWKVAHGDQATLSALVGLLGKTNGSSRRNVVTALGGTALMGDETAISALMPCIEQEENGTSMVADNVVLALGRVARGDQTSIAALIRRLGETKGKTKKH